MAAPRDGADGEARWLARLSAVARAVTSGDVSERASVAGRARFLSTFTRQRRRRTLASAAWGSAGLLAAGAAAAHLFQPAAHPDPASPVTENGYVSGGTTSSPSVRFVGGARVDFSASSRGRVLPGTARQPRVVLEGGRATVHGEARPPQDFVVEVGPYALESAGATFDVTWSGAELQVRVASGTVSVAGPRVRRDFVVYEDQTFVAREADGEVRCF